MGAIADRYARRATTFRLTVAAIDPLDWDAPTPCEQWTVRDVVRHVVQLHELLLRSLGRRPDSPGDPLAALACLTGEVSVLLADADDSDPLTGWADDTLGFDLVLHTWDVARASSQDDTIDPRDLALLWPGANARRTRATARVATVDQPREAPPTAARAGRWDQRRLLAVNGRHPDWRPPTVPRPRREPPLAR